MPDRALTLENLLAEIFEGRLGFDSVAPAVLSYQRKNCDVYRRFCESMAVPAGEYPYLPIEAFKLAAVTAFDPALAEIVFQSSGTTGQTRSVHYVRSAGLYHQSILASFSKHLGCSNTVVVGNLPGYVGVGRRSSLAYMVEYLISQVGPDFGGVFTDETEILHNAISHCDRSGKRLVLFGAAFGLLAFIEKEPVALPSNSIVIETGGMKTHRRAISRVELHERLANGFEIPRSQIASEYGMTELLSQAYSIGSEWYQAPAWLRVRIVDPTDSLRELPDGEEGSIAVVDLANLHSVAAILTEDVGVAKNGAFQVLGRAMGTELRGCNFLFTDE